MDLVVGPGGDFEVRMPDYWESAPMGGDPAATAAEAFPDDPTKAAVLQVVLDNFAVPQSLIVLVDGQGLGAELVADMAFIERGDAPGVDLTTVEGVLQDSAVDVGRTIVGSGRVQSPLGETTWFESTFDLSGVGTIHVIDYAAVVGGTVWKLTFWTDRMPEGRAVADEILATFALRA